MKTIRIELLVNELKLLDKEGPFDCIFDNMKSIHKLPYLVGCIILPMIIISFCYLRIFWLTYEVKSRLKATNLEEKKRFESIQLAKSLLLTFILFIICW